MDRREPLFRPNVALIRRAHIPFRGPGWILLAPEAHFGKVSYGVLRFGEFCVG